MGRLLVVRLAIIGDELIEAKITDGNSEIILASSGGKSIRFNESDVRPMGRNTRGVRGIALSAAETVVGMVVFTDNSRDVLAISARGYGKRTTIDDYRVQSRGGKGIITMKSTAKTGDLISINGVLPTDDLMIVTTSGIMIRMNVGDISIMGRNTQGVRVINLKDGDAIADVTRLVVDEDDDAATADDSAEKADDDGGPIDADND